MDPRIRRNRVRRDAEWHARPEYLRKLGKVLRAYSRVLEVKRDSAGKPWSEASK